MRAFATKPNDEEAPCRNSREAIENLLGAQPGKRRLLAAGAAASGCGGISERIEEILANEVQSSP